MVNELSQLVNSLVVRLSVLNQVPVEIVADFLGLRDPRRLSLRGVHLALASKAYV